MTLMDLHLSATVELDGRHLVLKLEDGQGIRLSRDAAPSLAEGEKISLRVLPEAQDALDRQDLARSLLNELMKADG